MRKVIFIIAGITVVLFAVFMITIKTASPNPEILVAPVTNSTTVDETSAHTLILWLLSNDKVYAFNGGEFAEGKKFDAKDLRKILVDQKKQYGDRLAVSIKTTKHNSYQNAITVLDEMSINNIKEYTIRPATQKEETLLETLNPKN